MNRKKIGNKGEKYAENYLVAQNYQIITNNYFARVGEIDLIAIDLTENKLVFVEVKTRTSKTFGSPQAALTPIKKLKILKAALHFINSSNPKYRLGWRFDLIGLQLNSSNGIEELNHFKNIFDD